MTWLFALPLFTLATIMAITTLTAAFCGVVAIRSGAPRAIVWAWFRHGLLMYIWEMPVKLLGLVAVAIALPFRVENISTSVPFTQYPNLGNWMMVNLPSWARPWDNPRDGMMGDKRGWFANWCIGRGWSYPSWLAMWWWAAVRNPANYYGRVTMAIDITDAALRKLAGTSVWANEDELGWHYITAERDGKLLGCLFQAAIRYPFSTRYGFYCRFGYKLELDEPQTVANDLYDRLRSPAWKVSFWKDLS